MSKSIISIARGTSTRSIVLRELDRIERMTGDCPEDWLWQMYDEDVDEFYTAEGYDWDAFEMHIACLADHYIDFVREHAKDLTIDF